MKKYEFRTTLIIEVDAEDYHLAYNRASAIAEEINTNIQGSGAVFDTSKGYVDIQCTHASAPTPPASQPVEEAYVDSDTLEELREQLLAQRVQTNGHGRRARIQEQIDAIDRELDDRANQKHAGDILSS